MYSKVQYPGSCMVLITNQLPVQYETVPASLGDAKPKSSRFGRRRQTYAAAGGLDLHISLESDCE